MTHAVMILSWWDKSNIINKIKVRLKVNFNTIILDAQIFLDLTANAYINAI